MSECMQKALPFTVLLVKLGQLRNCDGLCGSHDYKEQRWAIHVNAQPCLVGLLRHRRIRMEHRYSREAGLSRQTPP